MLSKKVDFSCVILVEGANPNGDPLYDNRPRQRLDGKGEISDVCLKRKIRNELSLSLQQAILLQSNGLETDEFRSMKERLDALDGYKKAKKEAEIIDITTKAFYDVRAFGQVFALNKGEGNASVRGPISIRNAVSVTPVLVRDVQITKSLNAKPGETKGSDTMGTKYLVDHGVYVFHGSISPQLAARTGFNDEDAELLKQAILGMFNSDASSARPAGSMHVLSLIWWEAEGMLATVNPRTLQDALIIKPLVEIPASVADYSFQLKPVVASNGETVTPTIYGDIEYSAYEI